MRLKKLLACLLGGVLVLTSLGVAPVQALAATQGKKVSEKLVYDDVYGVYGGYTLARSVAGTENNDGYVQKTYKYSVIDSKGKVTLTLGNDYWVNRETFGQGNGYFTAKKYSGHEGELYLYSSMNGSVVATTGINDSIAVDAKGEYAVVTKSADDKKSVTISVIRTSDKKVSDSLVFKTEDDNYRASAYAYINANKLYVYANTWTVVWDGDANNSISDYYAVENGKIKKLDKDPEYVEGDNKAVGHLNGSTLYYNVKYNNDSQLSDSGVYDARDGKGKQVTIGDYKLQITKSGFKPSSAQRGNQDMYYAIDSKGKYGAIDSKGNVLIPFDYDDIYDAGRTDTNLILVKQDGGWYLFDTSYKEPEKPSTSYVTMYRVYNRYSGEHLFTPDASERDRLVGLGWSDEGVGWYAPERSSTKVFRMYNPYSGDHLYTTKASERDQMVRDGWRQDEVTFYSEDAKEGAPLYRMYNPYVQVGTHHYTTDASERDQMVGDGWRFEPDSTLYGVKVKAE